MKLKIIDNIRTVLSCNDIKKNLSSSKYCMIGIKLSKFGEQLDLINFLKKFEIFDIPPSMYVTDFCNKSYILLTFLPPTTRTNISWDLFNIYTYSYTSHDDNITTFIGGDNVVKIFDNISDIKKYIIDISKIRNIEYMYSPKKIVK